MAASSALTSASVGGAPVAGVGQQGRGLRNHRPRLRPRRLHPGERQLLISRPRRGRAGAPRAPVRGQGRARRGSRTRSSATAERRALPRARDLVQDPLALSGRPSVSAAIAMPARTCRASSYACRRWRSGQATRRSRSRSGGRPPASPASRGACAATPAARWSSARRPGPSPVGHRCVASAMSPSFSASTAAHCRPIIAVAESSSSAIRSTAAVRSLSSSASTNIAYVARAHGSSGGPSRAIAATSVSTDRSCRNPEVAQQDAEGLLGRRDQLGRRLPALEQPLGCLGQREHSGVVAGDRPQDAQRGQQLYGGRGLVVDQAAPQHVGQVVLLGADLVDRGDLLGAEQALSGAMRPCPRPRPSGQPARRPSPRPRPAAGSRTRAPSRASGSAHTPSLSTTESSDWSTSASTRSIESVPSSASASPELNPSWKTESQASARCSSGASRSHDHSITAVSVW